MSRTIRYARTGNPMDHPAYGGAASGGRRRQSWRSLPVTSIEELVEEQTGHPDSKRTPDSKAETIARRKAREFKRANRGKY